MLEHVDLYASTGPGPVDDLDYCLPVGKAAVRRAGPRRDRADLPGDDRRTCSPRSRRSATSTPR